MNKQLFLFLFAIVFAITNVSAQDRSNTTTLAECIQEFSTAVNGYYGTRVLRISQGMTMPTIEKYMASWKANRCLWRGICLARETDFIYLETRDIHRLTIELPKGKAHLDFAPNKNGLFRFVGYHTEGNINSCPVGKTSSTNTFYAEVDLIGEWYFKDISWYEYPAAYKGALAVSQGALKQELEERVKKLSNPRLATLGVVVFEANGRGKYVTLNGEIPFQWRLQYNQLQVKEANDWEPLSWRIDRSGNLNLIDTDWGGSSGEPQFVYSRK
jgi:hypothetical protein